MIRTRINLKQLPTRYKNFFQKATPFAIPIICLSIAVLGSDAWLKYQLDEKQKINFQYANNRIAIQLENS